MKDTSVYNKARLSKVIDVIRQRRSSAI